MGAEAVKEPTMEDILASIRKIIAEDGDSETLDASNEAPSQQAASPAAVEVAPVSAPSAQEAVSPEPIEAEVRAPVVERREDLSAGLRGSVDTGSLVQTPSQSPDPVAAPSKVASHDPAGIEKPVFATDGAELHPAIQNAMAYINKDESGSDPAIQKNVSEPTPAKTQLISPDAVERRTDDDRRNHPMRREADRSEAEFKGALMSPQTDHSVGSAFEDLKAQLEGGLDREVEAMLRPMLREWLDNNLPTMVERLVRDEIERVARGDQ